MSDLTVKCDCGWQARGPEHELVPRIQAHAREAHGLEVTPEQALAQTQPANGSAAERPRRRR